MTENSIFYMIFKASSFLPLLINHLGLSGKFLRMQNKPSTPIAPTIKNPLQNYTCPKTIFSIDAKAPPKCHEESMMISALPLTEGGKNSSMAVNTAVNSPPTLIPVNKRPNINKVN